MCFGTIPQEFPFLPDLLLNLEPGTKIVKLGNGSGFTEGRLFSTKIELVMSKKGWNTK